MQFTEHNMKQWIQNGIQEETINAAFIAGWNLVCPNDKVSNIQDPIKMKGKDGGFIKIPMSELSESDLRFVVSRNKSDALTTSQIRIAFGEMRRIQQKGFIGEKTSFLMLKPKLAYAVKRHDKKGIKEFYSLFSWAYDNIDKQNDGNGKTHFSNFMQVMEAVLAYHKYHGGQ